MSVAPRPVSSAYATLVGVGVIVAAGLLAALGVISLAIQLGVYGLVVGFNIGVWFIVSQEAEAARLVAVAQTERFLAQGHRWLADAPDADPEQRALVEATLNAAQQSLAMLDQMAPWRERRARRKARR